MGCCKSKIRHKQCDVPALSPTPFNADKTKASKVPAGKQLHIQTAQTSDDHGTHAVPEPPRMQSDKAVPSTKPCKKTVKSSPPSGPSKHNIKISEKTQINNTSGRGISSTNKNDLLARTSEFRIQSQATLDYIKGHNATNPDNVKRGIEVEPTAMDQLTTLVGPGDGRLEEAIQHHKKIVLDGRARNDSITEDTLRYIYKKRIPALDFNEQGDQINETFSQKTQSNIPKSEVNHNI